MSQTETTAPKAIGQIHLREQLAEFRSQKKALEYEITEFIGERVAKFVKRNGVSPCRIYVNLSPTMNIVEECPMYKLDGVELVFNI